MSPLPEWMLEKQKQESDPRIAKAMQQFAGVLSSQVTLFIEWSVYPMPGHCAQLIRQLDMLQAHVAEMRMKLIEYRGRDDK